VFKLRIILYFGLIVIYLAINSCVSTSKFSSAQEAFDHKHYSTAANILEKKLNKGNVVNLKNDAFLLAESYRLMQNVDKSIYWYKKAINSQNGKMIRYKLASQYKNIENYTKALKVLNEIRIEYGNSAELQREIIICKQAKEWKENSENNIIVENLSLNTNNSEFATAFYLNDYIVFSSDRYLSSKNKYGWSGRYYYNLFLSDFMGIAEVSPLSFDINTKYNEASACFDSEGNEMFFVRCGGGNKDVQNCKIYRSVKVGDAWTEISLLPFEIDGVNYISPALSDDNKTLYFASDDVRGRGGYDVYLSYREGQTWSKPISLPKYINTVGDEKFISIYKDTLYFSSDYLAGLGGLDIFNTFINSNGEFVPPIHLDYPINSGGDDIYLLKNTDTSGVFSSSRIEGKGQDDIYRFRIKAKSTKNTTDSIFANNDDIEIKKDIFLAIKVVEKVFTVEGDPNSRVVGTKPINDVVIKLNGEKLETTDGFVLKQIAFDSLYKILVGKKGYLSKSEIVDIGSNSDFNNVMTTMNVKIVLDKIYLDKEIVLKDIHYDFDKWDLRPDAYPTLNELFNILRNNENYSIVLGSHTDCQGTDEYNLELSKNRAKSVVDYLIAKGINQNRLEAIGFGETKLISHCKCTDCSEDEHQKNRRTTFKLIEKN